MHILLLPNIETANVMYKTLTYTANTKNGGILVGFTIILTSRLIILKQRLIL